MRNGFEKPMAAAAAMVLLSGVWSCKERPSASGSQPASEPAGISAEKILEQTRSIKTGRTSRTKIRAEVMESGGDLPLKVIFTIYEKREPDQSRHLLVQLTDPPAERDRSGLLRVDSRGDIEAVRYSQSANRFVSARGATGEDSLFGMTLQELVGGQPEKYDYKVDGETSINGASAYRLDGRIKEEAESRFPRSVLLVSKEHFVILSIEFYDMRGDLARRLTIDKIENSGGYWTRRTWLVENPARSKTIKFEALEAEYDRPIAESVFSRDHLKKISLK
jgi:hypothetical protein